MALGKIKVLAVSELIEGELVSYYCEFKKKDVQGEVIGSMDGASNSILVVKCLDNELADLIDIGETFVYRVGKTSSQSHLPSCECGAKHTSNPTYHLTFCPILATTPPPKW